MKKRILIIIIIVWLLIGIIDFTMAMTCHRPIFCINIKSDGHYEKYVGFGYSFDIIDNSQEFFKIDAYKGYVFGKEVCKNYMD